MTYTISKEFAWSASHQLRGLPVEHQCARLHGHNYIARVELVGEHLDDTGFVLDYAELAPVKRFIDANYDHRHLNDVRPFDTINPTAENLARELVAMIIDRIHLPAGVSVTVAVSETPKTWARYIP